MQVITTTIYRTLGHDFTSEDEAKQFEAKYMSDNCNVHPGDRVYFLDVISCRITESRVSDITINDADGKLYVYLENYQGGIRVEEVYMDLNLLIYNLRSNMVSLINS